MKHTSTSPEVKIHEQGFVAVVQIDGEPQVFQRPSSTGKQFQSVPMMTFQQLIMFKAGAALGSKGLNTFVNPVSVEIIYTTLDLFKDIELEYVIKSVLDGLNKSIIQDDSLVVMAQCWLKKGTKRSPKAHIDITIRDVVNSNTISFKLDTPAIQKEVAVAYDVGGVLQYDPQFLLELSMIHNAVSTVRGPNNNQYEICHMCFYTEDMSKDVDNLFLMYIRALRKNGLLDSSNNMGIGMYKRRANIGEGKTIINLVSK